MRIGLQYGASPFTAFSHDILNSLLAISEFLFTGGITGYNYTNLSDGGANFFFVLSILLLFTPTLIILLYELVNM